MAAVTIHSDFGAQENKMGFSGGSDSKEYACNAGDWVDPWVRKILWRRECLSPPVFLPGELYGQRSLVGCSSWGCKESDVTNSNIQIGSDQISCSVVSNSLRPHESQHARPPCPSPTPGVHPDSRPSSQWCHPATSSSVVPFSSFPQSLPASESFPVSQLFAWGGQSTG